MIRLLHAYFPKRTLFLAISEACLISFSLAAVSLAWQRFFGVANSRTGPGGSFQILAVTCVFVACMHCFDLYDSRVLGKRREALVRLLQVLGAACFLLALISYIYPPAGLRPGIFLAAFAAVATLLWLWRELFLLVNTAPRFAERALVLGEGPLANFLVHECESRPELGIRIVGRDLPPETRGIGASRTGGAAAGSSQESEFAEKLARSMERMGVGRIIVALTERRGELPVGLLLSLKSRGVRVQDGVELYERITGKIPVESLRISSLLFSAGFYASRLFLMYKRAASVAASCLGLALSLPLLPFILAAIKLASPGPVLYRQKRVGQNGAVFDCYKFRTMRADAEADTGPTWAGDDDPRITPVGKLLRRTRADEIPQLWNVLRGDMCLVGPRPERPEFVDELRREIPYYQMRHTIRLGITGWAQIRYKYGNSVEDAKAKLRYDLFYIMNMSAGLDVLILFQTVKVILWGRGVR